MTRKQIIAMLRTGNFTLAYHDNQYCVLYRGHHDYDHLPKREITLPPGGEGYIPVEVELLVEALGGKVETV